jgi:hypothetical protein
MISDSTFWKRELLREANWLKNHTAPPIRSLTATLLSKFEKSLFLGALSIRKLLDSEKLTDKAKTRCVKAVKFLWDGKPVTLIERSQLDNHYDFSKGKTCTLGLRDFCNQLIHSYVFQLTFFDAEGGVNGFFLVSDRDRHSHVYFINADDIQNLFRTIAYDEVTNLEMKRQLNGQMKITKSN